MQYKTTNRLFRGIYQYKVVLVCAGASWFRSGDWDSALEQLQKVSIAPGPKLPNTAFYQSYRYGIKTQEDLDYAFKLQATLKTLKDIELRVESPLISVYTNTKLNIDKIIALDEGRIKYVSVPPANTILNEKTIIMPKMNYDYRITLGKTSTEHSAFISWAESNKKVKLTKSCTRDLKKDRSWGGTHFYLSGDNNLLMAKMHLGSSINKVERIIKA